jgi:BirA family biotin operon repressor/biotin-[acetyl-CoA-carboxylase] ligase
MSLLRTNSTKRALVEYLLRHPDTIVSGAELCGYVNVSRQAVSKAVEGLREEGFPVESLPQRGYRFQSAGETRISPSWIESLLGDIPFGHPTLAFERTASTQFVVKEFARDGAEQGLLVFADEQTQGRGRRGRSWESPPGKGLYFSFLLRPSLRMNELQLLSLATGLAVRDTLEELLDVPATLKWPNDVLWRGRKLCGILCEAAIEPDRVHYAVIGLGINLSLSPEHLPEDLRQRVTSLEEATERNIPKNTLAAAIVRRFYGELQHLYEPRGALDLVEAYRRKCETIGSTISVLTGDEVVQGTAMDVTGEGTLVVDTPQGRRLFPAADVVHLRRGGDVPFPEGR